MVAIATATLMHPCMSTQIKTKNESFVGRALPAVGQTFIQYSVGQCPAYQT